MTDIREELKAEISASNALEMNDAGCAADAALAWFREYLQRQEVVERAARAIYCEADGSGNYQGPFEFRRIDGALVGPTGTLVTLDGQYNLITFAEGALAAILPPTDAKT